MILSICIPCYKRIEHVRNTLKSIYIDNADVSIDDYEVVITDNDPELEVKKVVDEFESFPNIRYIPTKCEGFMNSYHALKNGKGDLLKLHNSQNMINKGMLSVIVDQAKECVSSKPLIVHTNGLLNHHGIRKSADFNTYMLDLSYWSSSSAGMTIWREDFEKIGDIELNPLFPHTSISLTQWFKDSFIIDDRLFYNIQRVAKRGGHNKFEAFTIHYPSLINQCFEDGHITQGCKDYILGLLYKEYIPTLLFNKYIARIETFEADGFKENCKKYFPKGAYWIAWANVLCVPFRMVKRRFNHYVVARYKKQ